MEIRLPTFHNIITNNKCSFFSNVRTVISYLVWKSIWRNGFYNWQISQRNWTQKSQCTFLRDEIFSRKPHCSTTMHFAMYQWVNLSLRIYYLSLFISWVKTIINKTKRVILKVFFKLPICYRVITTLINLELNTYFRLQKKNHTVYI